MAQSQNQLIDKLRTDPSASEIAALVTALEKETPADLSRDGGLLEGVWELRWSSSPQPWLKQAPWLDNLQILDLNNGRGCNLLKLHGPLGDLAGIRVEAEIATGEDNRVEVRFRRGGWVGPRLPGGRKLQLLREVKQSFPAWLDITVLDETLRICRGYAGTIFCLLRRPDLAVSDFF